MSANLNDLSLEDGVTYYASVYAVDKVGNESFASSEITIDQTPPTVGAVISNDNGTGVDSQWSSSKNNLFASWSPFEDDSGIDFYEIAIGTSTDADNVSMWKNIGNETSYQFSELNLQESITYYVNVRATDLTGNVSAVASSNGFLVDTTAPTISAVSVQPNSTVSLFDNLTVKIILSEPILNADVVSSAAITLPSRTDYTLVDSITIDVIVYAPFTSGDEISFTIQNHTDRAGNIGLPAAYYYNIGYLADYDLDGSIGVSDFNQFVTGWFSKDLKYELGPVTGSAPNLRPALDGAYNSQDGMAFYYMWHWDNGQAGKLVAKRRPLEGDKLVLNYTNDQLLISPPEDTYGSEIIINYPSDQIQILSENNTINNAVMKTLSKTDTLSGQILSHSLLESKDIVFNLDFRARKDVPIQISYEFIDEQNQKVGSGYTDFVLTPLPTEFALKQNYPNPFNPVTTINYDLPNDALIDIMIYDILGREVKSLHRGLKQAGYHTVIWDSKDNQGGPVSAGIYLYQIRSKEFVKTKKMILLK